MNIVGNLLGALMHPGTRGSSNGVSRVSSQVDRAQCVSVVWRKQSPLPAVEHQMGGVTLEPPSEEDESDDREDEDDDWVWHSARAHLTKRSNSQVRLWVRALTSAGAGG